jgi:hypothetical protein
MHDCDKYWQHINDQNGCTEYECHFITSSNIYQVCHGPCCNPDPEQHKVSHRAKGSECYLCDRIFKNYSGIVRSDVL